MLYDHLTETCFSDKIGGAGLDRDEFASVLAETPKGLEKVRAWKADGSLPILRLPGETVDIERTITPVAMRFRGTFKDVIILGTGGSSLGGQTLYGLTSPHIGDTGVPRLHFMDNVDPHTFTVLLDRLDLHHTGLIAISKSGGTAETLTQFGICLEAYRRAGVEPSKAITVVTEPKDNPLRRLAERYGMETLDHDPKVGGRFSVFSVVGLLPAAIAGVNVTAVRHGANQVLDQALRASDPAEVPAAVGAALNAAAKAQWGMSQTVLMPYIDRLALLGKWYRQLWAESLGKDGHGTTPIDALGTVDQHSQLQLYLAGPADKLFSVFTLAVAGEGATVPGDITEDDSLAYLRGRTMGDLMNAEQHATIATLARNGRPVREFRLTRLDEAVLGGLMMQFMLETMITAELWGVNAFDQPAVEEGKILAREMLAETGN